MSFYSTRPKRPSPGAKAALSLVRSTISRAAAGTGGNVDWTLKRKAKSINYMLPAGIAWLKRLPIGLRPMALAKQYPRIANTLAHEWDNPQACRAYFDSLLTDRRGNRQGFPADVDREIRKLAVHYLRHHLTLLNEGETSRPGTCEIRPTRVAWTLVKD